MYFIFFDVFICVFWSYNMLFDFCIGGYVFCFFYIYYIIFIFELFG